MQRTSNDIDHTHKFHESFRYVNRSMEYGIHFEENEL